MSNPNYNYTSTHVEIKIHKPVYGTFVYIREEHIKRAKMRNLKLLITIPQGTYERDPDDWILNSKRIEKVFLRPDEPMVLLGNHVVHKKIEQLQQPLF